jgi:RHS repeat-associated protein
VNGVFTYLASDRQGSPVVALNASGSPVASQLYTPYGGVRFQSAALPTDYGFTGQRADSASGLSYYGSRYYDTVAGQFTSADSVVPGGGFSLWGLSRYAYTEANPSSRTDPSGHVSSEPIRQFIQNGENFNPFCCAFIFRSYEFWNMSSSMRDQFPLTAGDVRQLWSDVDRIEQQVIEQAVGNHEEIHYRADMARDLLRDYMDALKMNPKELDPEQQQEEQTKDQSDYSNLSKEQVQDEPTDEPEGQQQEDLGDGSDLDYAFDDAGFDAGVGFDDFGGEFGDFGGGFNDFGGGFDYGGFDYGGFDYGGFDYGGFDYGGFDYGGF